MPQAVTARPLGQLPEVTRGDDVADLLLMANEGAPFAPEDVIVISHKVVSKAEGRTVALRDVTPSTLALTVAAELGRVDAPLIEVILSETAEVIRAEHGILICRTHHGFVCANAGVDQSNAGGDDRCVLLPADPDGSARRLRSALPGRPAVVIADSFGRAWRHGECDVAIGVAGLVALDDRRGGTDRDDRELRVSSIAIADQAAATADLARGGKASGRPAVVLSGLAGYVTEEDGPGVAPLLRSSREDLFGPR